MIRLILLLFRNILAIRDGQPGINSTVESLTRSTLQERLVECMASEHVLEMLAAFCGSMDNNSSSSMMKSAEFADWNTVVLEIVAFIYWRRSPDDVAAEDSAHKVEKK